MHVARALPCTNPLLRLRRRCTLNCARSGKAGAAYNQFQGFCLETQYYPDAPNHQGFPSSILHPGKVSEAPSRYEFTACDMPSETQRADLNAPFAVQEYVHKMRYSFALDI